MSKFFKALQQAERERTLGERVGPADSPTEARTTEPEATTVEQADEASVAEPVEVPERSATLVPREAATGDRASVQEATDGGHGTFGRALGVLAAPPRDALGVEVPPASAGVAPEDVDGPESHLVSLHTPTSFAAEQYRTLRHVIEHEHVQVIAVTSPGVGDGKTTTTVNLAGALAQASDARVLVIDCDLRRPSIGKFLGLMPHRMGHGLVELLVDRRLPLDAAIVTRRPYNLDILPAGTPPSNPYEVLKSARLPELIEEARKRYHFVILDTPPAVPLPDCRLLAGVVDAFVVVVAANRTSRRLLQETLETLDRGKVLGVTFNKDDTPMSGYYEYKPYFQSANGHGKSRWARMVSRIRSFRPRPATRRRKK